jgi:hypothetical protein
MRQVPNANRRLEDHVLRALNKIRKPSAAEEITELLNRDLGPGERPFRKKEVANCYGTQVTRYSDCKSEFDVRGFTMTMHMPQRADRHPS